MEVSRMLSLPRCSLKILFVSLVLQYLVLLVDCECEQGYELVDTACQDINECLQGGQSQCGQLCTNAPGSYQCSCLPGYELEADGWSCSVEDFSILFSHGDNIAIMDPGGVNINPVLEGVGDVKSFDYHYGNKSLFWIDGQQKAILSAPLLGGQSQFVIDDLKRPRQLAIDWIHDTIYWTDSKTRLIERVDLQGSQRVVVVTTQQGRPNALTLDPFKRFVFWSASGRRERIERSDMDGSNYQSIVTSGLEEVVSITVDIVDKRLFWLDNGLSKIESVDYDGSNRKVVVMEEPSNELYGLALFTDQVYWSESTSNSLSQANKYTGHDLVMMRTTYLDTHAKSISVLDSLKQPDTDPTASVNCSTSEDCRLDITMGPPAEAKPFIVITNKQDIQRINFDGTKYQLIAHGQMENLVAMDYDVREEMVYFADQGRRVIERVSLTNPSDRKVVVGPDDIDVVEGIAIDWIRRRLYWTDSGKQTISTCHMEGGTIRTIVERNLRHPKAIAVHPALNLVYWSDIAEPAKIEAARSHDGTHRVTVALNLTNPSSITIDYLNNQLIWLDSARLTIEIASLDGTYRKVITDRNLGRPFGLAEFDNFVWYSEWNKNLLIQVNKTSGGRGPIRLKGQFNQPSGLQVVHPNSKDIGQLNPCFVFNGGCEQICLLAHVNQVICSCNAGYTLRPDGVSCSMDECWTGTAQCHPQAICINREEGYDCRCKPGYIGNGYHCFAPTTPRSQLIAGPALTVEPDYPTTSPTTASPRVESATTMSRRIVANTKTVNNINTGGSLGSLTPRRSTTAAPGRISTTIPPKGRRPGGKTGVNVGSKTPGSGNTGTNKGGSVVNSDPNGKPKDGKITTNGSSSRGGNGGSGVVGGKPGISGNGSSGTVGQNNGNRDQNGNKFDTNGMGNLFPGVAGGPSVTLGYQPTTAYSHFGQCPNEYKYYCLNGGKCTWLVKLEKPSCSCVSNFGGERCLWVKPSFKSGINDVTVAAISGGILLPLIIFFLIVAFILYRKKKQGKAETLRKASRPEITLQPINFSHSPIPGVVESKNNSASISKPSSFFGSSLSLSGSKSGSSRRESICTALISPEEEYQEPSHITAVQTRSDPTADSPGSPSMMKAVLSRLSDPSSSETIRIPRNHYQVPKRSHAGLPKIPKPQFKLAGGVAAMARRHSQNSNNEKDDEEHTYSIASHYAELSELEQEKPTKLTTFMSTMPRGSSQNSTNKYMAMEYNYPTASLGRRTHDSIVYVNTPKKSSSASQVFSCHVQL